MKILFLCTLSLLFLLRLKYLKYSLKNFVLKQHSVFLATIHKNQNICMKYKHAFM